MYYRYTLIDFIFLILSFNNSLQYYQDSQRTPSNDILDEKYIPTADSVVIDATSNGCNGLTPTPNSPKCAKVSCGFN